MKYLVSFLFLAIFTYSCTPDEIEEVNTTFYSTSFENAIDTANWQGACWISFSDDVPDGGGNRSVSISCGCIGLYANFLTEPTKNDGLYTISCQGKGLGIGGFIALKYNEKEIGIGLSGQDTIWQYHQSPDTLFCPAGEQMEVYLSAGGLMDGTIKVDLLEITKVD